MPIHYYLWAHSCPNYEDGDVNTIIKSDVTCGCCVEVLQERGLTPLALDAATPALKTDFTKQDVLNAIDVIFNMPRQ